MSLTSSANPWLAWLYDGASAPYGVSVEMTVAAVGTLDRQARKALRTFLSQTPVLATYRAFQVAMDDYLAMLTWADTVMVYGPKRDQRPMGALIHKAQTRMQRLWNRVTRPGSPYHRHLAKLEGKLRRAGEVHWATMVAGERAVDSTAASEQRDKRIHQLTRTLVRRQQRYSRQLREEGGLHLTTWPAPPHEALQAQAQHAAEQRGLTGYLILPNSWPNRFLLYYAYDEATRHAVWQMGQQVVIKPSEIEAMRALRQEEAEAYELPDYATYAFSSTLFSTPSRAERWLGGALDRLRQPIHQALDAGSSRVGMTEEQARLPWNFRHTLTAAQGRTELSLPPNAFPWRATALKIIPELMALGGWTCLSAPALMGRGLTRLLRFRLRHHDGRRAQLWYSPFNPSPKAGDQNGAMCTAVRQSLADQPEIERVVFVEQYMTAEADQMGMDVLDISYLCHELGHALHYLAMPGHHVGETQAVTMDFIETPAILLENYYAQPETLIRWLGRSAPPALRHSAYWARRLNHLTSLTVGFHQQIYRPYVDLRLHRKHTGPLGQVMAEADSRGGFVRHPEQRAELNYFAFGEGEGAMGLSHISGAALAMRLLPLHEHGQVRSADVGARMTALLDQVLSHGADRRALHRSWRALTGEGFVDSMNAGMMAITRRHRRVLKQAAQRA